jgi:hypothetical protein
MRFYRIAVLGLAFDDRLRGVLAAPVACLSVVSACFLVQPSPLYLPERVAPPDSRKAPEPAPGERQRSVNAEPNGSV